MTRRDVLCAAAAIALGAAGCGRAVSAAPGGGGTRAGTATGTPAPSPSGEPRPVVVVNANDLMVVSGALTAAWAASAPSFDVQWVAPSLIDQQRGGIPSAPTGDLLEVQDARAAPSGKLPLMPLRESLEAANVDLSALLPGALPAFTSAAGDLLGIPLMLGEIQFYVNAPRLAALGIAEPQRWQWSDLLGAADRVAASQSAGSTAPSLAIGEGWCEPNVWGAFVLGLGGDFVGSGGQLDLVDGAASATQALLNVAETFGWKPLQNYAAPLRTEAFQGPTAGVLFYFDAPWAGPASNPNCNACALTPRPFPQFPHQNWVPASTPAGLGIAATTQQAGRAAEFLAWLLQPAQQQVLAEQALPPLVQTPQVQDAWAALTGRNPIWPAFEPAAYFDLTAHLPAMIPSGGLTLGAWVSGVFNHLSGELLNEGMDVAPALQDIQDTLNQGVVLASSYAARG